MKKLTKMFAVIVVVFAPLCFTACQEEGVIAPTYNTEPGDDQREPEDQLD